MIEFKGILQMSKQSNNDFLIHSKDSNGYPICINLTEELEKYLYQRIGVSIYSYKLDEDIFCNVGFFHKRRFGGYGSLVDNFWVGNENLDDTLFNNTLETAGTLRFNDDTQEHQKQSNEIKIIVDLKPWKWKYK